MQRSKSLVAASVAAVSLLAAMGPVGAITGGSDDSPTDPEHPNVGLIYFYEATGRYRCSGTLIDPQVVLTAAHCTADDVGKVIVTFDADVARTAEQGRMVSPRAFDDPGTGEEGSGYDDGLWIVVYDTDGTPLTCDPIEPDCDDDGIVRAPYDNSGWNDGTVDGSPIWHTGTPVAHPEYSNFTDLKNWNDTGLVLLDDPVVDIEPALLAPPDYLSQFSQRQLVKTLVHSAGYGTEVRRADSGPQTPTPMSYPIRRQHTDEKVQKLTSQILQANGNEKDPFGGGGTCFGDSGGPLFLNGYVVGDTSYGYTDNCRYLGGYQRVDIPIVRDWILSYTG